MHGGVVDSAICGALRSTVCQVGGLSGSKRPGLAPGTDGAAHSSVSDRTLLLVPII